MVGELGVERTPQIAAHLRGMKPLKPSRQNLIRLHVPAPGAHRAGGRVYQHIPAKLAMVVVGHVEIFAVHLSQ